VPLCHVLCFRYRTTKVAFRPVPGDGKGNHDRPPLRADAERPENLDHAGRTDGVLNWWDKDHVSILGIAYKSGLFILLMGLIVHFGLIPATIAATLINKDVGEALKQLVKLLKGGGSQDGQS
jgi:hypothetical protein